MTGRLTRVTRPVMLTPSEAAGRLGVSRAQVYRWIDSGALPHVSYPTGDGKPGGPKRVTETDLETFINTWRQEATA